MTMTKIPLGKAWYAYRHGPLIFLFQNRIIIYTVRPNGITDKEKLFSN